MANVTALLLELEERLRGIYPTIAFGFGEKDISRNDLAPPRIVWVPTTGLHSAAEKQSKNPRSVLTRNPAVVAHCWAVDDAGTGANPFAHYDACEALVHDLIVSIYRSAWGSIAFDGEEWLQPDQVDYGHVALVKFSPKVPVLEKTYRKVQVTKLEAEARNVVPGDNNIDWSEP